MGTPRCRSAGTHLVEGVEIHGDAEGRSAGNRGECASAGAKLRLGGGAGDFIETGRGRARRAGPGGALPGRAPPSAARPAADWLPSAPPRPGRAGAGPGSGRDPAGSACAGGVGQFSRLETEAPGRDRGRRWGRGSSGNRRGRGRGRGRARGRKADAGGAEKRGESQRPGHGETRRETHRYAAEGGREGGK